MYGCQQNLGRETGGYVEVSPNVQKSVNRIISSFCLCWELKERKGPKDKGNPCAKGQQQRNTKTKVTFSDYGLLTDANTVDSPDCSLTPTQWIALCCN